VSGSLVPSQRQSNPRQICRSVLALGALDGALCARLFRPMMTGMNISSRLRGLLLVTAALGAVVTVAVPASAGDATPTVLSRSDVDAALLGRSDLPAGWHQIRGTSATPGSDGFCGGRNASVLANQLGARDANGLGYIRDFERGPIVGELLYSFPSVRAARNFMAQSRVDSSGCRSYDQSASTGKFHAVLRPARPPLGDTPSFAVLEVSTGNGQVSYTDLNYVRSVNNVFVLIYEGQRRGRRAAVGFTRTARRKLATTVEHVRKSAK
jgi:hypothetical protein